MKILRIKMFSKKSEDDSKTKKSKIRQLGIKQGLATAGAGAAVLGYKRADKELDRINSKARELSKEVTSKDVTERFGNCLDSRMFQGRLKKDDARVLRNAYRRAENKKVAAVLAGTALGAGAITSGIMARKLKNKKNKQSKRKE